MVGLIYDIAGGRKTNHIFGTLIAGTSKAREADIWDLQIWHNLRGMA